jgi:hypothetical protein
MSDIAAVTAPISTPNVPPVATGSEPVTDTNHGWPKTKIIGTDNQVIPEAGLEAKPDVNPDDPWMPDEALAGKKTKLKVDGKEIDCTVGELHKFAQLGIAANNRMQEASRIKREAEDSHTMLAETMRDPRQFFTRMIESDEGKAIQWIDQLAQIAADRLQMSPEQRELDRYKRTEEYRRQEAAQRQQQETAAKVGALWNKAIQMSGLEDTPVGHAVAAEMRERVQAARRTGRAETPSTLAAFAKQRVQEITGTIHRTLTPAQRQQLVTPEDLQAQAKARATQPMMASTPAREPNTGRFQSANQPQFYDPYA